MTAHQLSATKIVATVGPATDGLEEALVAAGVSVFRINFSHGEPTEHEARANAIRAAAKAQARHVALLGDLQGPKIRIAEFADDSVQLEPGASFRIDSTLDPKGGTVNGVGTTYTELSMDCAPGDVLVLGDGLIELEVTTSQGAIVECRVITGGELGSKKGINKRGGGLSAPAITRKDEDDIRLAAGMDIDYLAVSFPRSGADMHTARDLVRRAGLDCALVAKIERAETVADDDALDEIITASDAVMIARGDLGIEIGYPALMGVQKRIAQRARLFDRPVITATQMMESMITNPSPTRAEVLDVANAVLDGTDAIMLSGETAVGEHPVKVVEAVVEVLRGAETTAEQTLPLQRRTATLRAVDNAIALAVMAVARQLQGVAAIACFTNSGNTARLMSRYLSRIPIYAMVERERTLARCALYRGVKPVYFQSVDRDYDSMNQQAVQWLVENEVVKSGDLVIVSKGDLREVRVSGGTNTLKIIRIP